MIRLVQPGAIRLALPVMTADALAVGNEGDNREAFPMCGELEWYTHRGR
jgi:hypothetical protein